MNKISKIAVSLIVLAAFGLSTACNSASLVSILNDIVVAADAALAVLSASGQVPQPVVAAVDAYLNEVTTAVAESTKELESSDTTAVKDTKLAEIWSGVVLKDIPGIPPAVEFAIKAVEAAVNAFLAQMGMPVSGTPSFRAHAISDMVSKLPPGIASTVVKPNFRQRVQLMEVRHKAEAIKAKLKK